MEDRSTCRVLMVHRTLYEPPASTPLAEHRFTDVYDPWRCVACGHPHHQMTRHHRLPKRIAWKVPETVWREVLQGDQRVVPMCEPCHRFVETKKRGPCKEALDKKYALLTYERLMFEIATFDHIAHERTEALITEMREKESGRRVVRFSPPASGAGSREFKSRRPDHKFAVKYGPYVPIPPDPPVAPRIAEAVQETLRTGVALPRIWKLVKAAGEAASARDEILADMMTP